MLLSRPLTGTAPESMTATSMPLPVAPAFHSDAAPVSVLAIWNSEPAWAATPDTTSATVFTAAVVVVATVVVVAATAVEATVVVALRTPPSRPPPVRPLRVSDASWVILSTPGTARSASIRSAGTLALKPWKTEYSWPTEPPRASTARSGPLPVPADSWTMTGTSSAEDGVAASATDAITGPATPAARNAAVATVATLRACWGSPPHVTPREKEAVASSRLSTTCTSVCWLQCLAQGESAHGGASCTASSGETGGPSPLRGSAAPVEGSPHPPMTLRGPPHAQRGRIP